MLPIHEINSLQDWEKQGNYLNAFVSMLSCYDNYFLPFSYRGGDITHDGANSVVDFELRELDDKRLSQGIKEIKSTTVLSTSLITLVSGSVKDTFYYPANVSPDVGVNDGIYEFYIKVTGGVISTEFISEPFCYSFNSTGSDFNDDFNDDFNI